MRTAKIQVCHAGFRGSLGRRRSPACHTAQGARAPRGSRRLSHFSERRTFGRVIPEAEHTFLQILSEATRFLSGKSVHILHSHRYKENVLGALLARRCRVPFLARSQHGAPEPFTGWPRYKQDLLQVLDRLVARYSTDCVISVSAELGRQLTRYLPASKVVTIYNGLDGEQVSSPFSVSEAKQHMSIPVDGRRLPAESHVNL